MNISLTILKAIMSITGFGLTAANFFPGIIKNDKPKLKKAGKFFLITWVVLIVITIIEFAIIAR